jgi:hypothetical protein
MNVWQVVTLIVTEVHQHQNPIEHADGWHCNCLFQQRSNIELTQIFRALHAVDALEHAYLFDFDDFG